jgi:Effector Associated Constant Component 1
MLESLVLSLTGTSDDATDLYTWLSRDGELRGHVRLAPAAVPEGALGADLTQLVVTLESGGMATAFASVLVAWIKRRAGTVSMKVTRPDGAEFELTAERVRVLDAEDLQKQAAQLAAIAWPGHAAVTRPGKDRAAGPA